MRDLKNPPETCLHGHFYSRQYGRFIPSIGPWWLESDDGLKTQVMWSPAPSSSGSLWSQERRSEGLSLYRNYGKEIQCLCSCRHTVCRDLRAFSERKTGDGWWQLLVNNLISGSSALYLFYLPAFSPSVTCKKDYVIATILKNPTPVEFLQFVCGTPRTTAVNSWQYGPKRCGVNKRCWFLKTWQLNTTMHTYD